MKTLQYARLASAIILAPILLLGFQTIGYGQTFGKNKVQYSKFDWYFIQSDHFDIYFSDHGDELAEFTAKAAEEALGRIQRDFKYQITNRIPIIVYNSPNAFQQTNVVGADLSEGIGGVTELFKNRIVLPFNGSYKDFRHVIHHELIHAFLNDMLYGGSLQTMIMNNIQLQLPLWFNEGLAEYHSLGGWDTNSDMFLRDAAISNYLPPIQYLNGYFAYRGGQSVWWYIAEKYGKQKVGEILVRIRSTRSVDAAFKTSIGLNVEELSERWQKEQRVLYWPDVKIRTSPEDYAKRLTDHTELSSFYNTSPAISPTGDKIAFISDRDDFFSVYVMNATDEEKVERVVEGQTTSDFEDLNLLTPGITWSPDGKKIAFAAKSGANDAIHVIDIEEGDRERLPVELEGIYSVSWAPTGDKIAFIGNIPGKSDLWVYNVRSRKAENLTNDYFTDAQPSWSPDGSTIYFISDRGSYLSTDSMSSEFDISTHDYSQRDIYSYNVEARTIRRITNTPTVNEANPVMGPDGFSLLFISDQNGINNLYVRNLNTDSEYPITNSISAIYQFSLSRDGNKLAFASMYEAGFDVFLLKSPFQLPKIENLPPTEFFDRLARSMALGNGLHPSLIDSTNGKGEEKTYGDDVSVQLGQVASSNDTATTAGTSQRMTFADGKSKTAGARKEISAPKRNMTDDGTYVVNKYKLSFSPDLIYGNAGYNTFYGILGTTQMAFSDMLGNHQIYFVTNLIGDLKNSDYALAYFHLPDRIDWGIQGFHSARFLTNSYDYWGELYRYRQYGASFIASYPINRFYRVDGSLTFMNVTQENLDNPEVPISERTVLIPNVGFVHDNTLWGTWSPVKGTRYEIRAFGSPGIGTRPLSFTSATLDYRWYNKFGEDVSLVLRGSGGASFGANPQRFFIGGTENWINRTFEGGSIPIENVEDFAFLMPALPLRGYNYNARIATRYALGNAELRFPLVKYFLGGVLPYILQTLNAAMFVDVGTAFDSFDNYRAFGRNEQGELMNQNLLIGTGYGFRMWFLGFPLKFDMAWAYNGAKFSQPKFYISLGADF